MSPRREGFAFAAALAALLASFFADTLYGGKVLSPADVLKVQASFGGGPASNYEPANRLLMDPVLQFQPWLEFNRAELRRGRLPLWNPLVGCGAPHLANGQCAVFDPFHAIAYLGRLPDAYAPMAFARLWTAGLGMFLLARRWRLGRWGRWFAGLAFPLCGFLVAWLLFPVTSVAVWMPWLFLATDRVLDRPGARGVGWLALAVGLVLLGGHVQTSAHVLLAAAAYGSWRLIGRRTAAPLPRWALGMGLGLAVAAVEVLPLGAYLARSPVWSDRARERPPVLAVGRPRLLDAACTALPYAFGSQRRGHPNLAKAVGVHNLNESAGGFAGLATLMLLAPLALAGWRADPRARFLGALTAFGVLGAFEVPPVANLLRAVPVLDVMDQRRLTLWVAFGLVLLGGIGLDRLDRLRIGRAWGWWAWGACVLAIVAGSVAIGFGPLAGPKLRAKALSHYEEAAAREPGADRAAYRERAERQARQALHFVPRYYGLAAGQLALLVVIVVAARRGKLTVNSGRAAVFALVLLDLNGFGRGLNPAIDRGEHEPASAVIDHLRRVAPPPARVVSVGAELPPNTLLRFGVADVRNYDSVELSRSLDWFSPLYDAEPGRPARTSRRPITWAGVARAQDRLRLVNVAAAVGATEPPRGMFAHVERVGRSWVVRLGGNGSPRYTQEIPGEIRVDAPASVDDGGWVPVTYDPGWTAEADGQPARAVPHRGAFLAARVSPGTQVLRFRYRPIEVRTGVVISLSALAIVGGALVVGDGRKSARKIPAGAWMARAGRVRIEFVISSRCSPPATT